jgi:thiol-disulfide isomerase/thioredoxin
MLKPTMWVAALLAGWATTGAVAEELNVGDPAPKLAIKEFVKGDPVAQLEKGKTYVVEFWATWCGPCRTTIPHLTELQKRYKDITFIGVSVLENDPKGVKPFVDQMGDKMDYRVAIDAMPEGGKAGDGAMAKSWMEAAAQEGIPTAFVVNGDGKIAWIGHPMAMDKPLADIVAGKWDLQAASAQFKREQAPKRKLIALQIKLNEASKSGDSKEVLKVIDLAIVEDPGLEPRLWQAKFRILAEKGGNPDKAQTYGKRLVDTVLKDDPDGLHNLAFLIAELTLKPDAKLVKVALAAAQRADKLAQGKDAAIAVTLAKAYFVSGDAAKALESQERAIKLAKGTPLEKNKEMQKRLLEYKKAAERSAGQGERR